MFHSITPIIAPSAEKNLTKCGRARAKTVLSESDEPISAYEVAYVRKLPRILLALIRAAITAFATTSGRFIYMWADLLRTLCICLGTGSMLLLLHLSIKVRRSRLYAMVELPTCTCVAMYA
ncbi:hypothetical protein F5B21DRAFT_484096 [Xylaria acuta]|nr:hypothetical protein F5B21DRAFT_484096 [Xylaria acuta]